MAFSVVVKEQLEAIDKENFVKVQWMEGNVERKQVID